MFRRRIYQLWPSSNRFYMRGLIISGPNDDFPISICPYIVFVIIIILYIYFILPDMLHHNIILFIGFILSFMVTITFMLLTSFTDPAIIPRRPFLTLLQHQIQQQHDYNYSQLYKIKQYQRIQYLLYENSDVHQIFCSTCQIYRPISTSHCRQCDNCILEVDHHCPWVNACIGRNNYKWFILFIVSLIVMMLSLCCNVVVWVDYVTTKQSQQATTNNNILSIYVMLCLVIVGLLLIVIIGFFVFHMILKCKGKTTREFIKQNRRGKQAKIRKQHQQQQQKQFKHQAVSRSPLLTTENHNYNNNDICDRSNTTMMLTQHRYLDNFLRNNYIQPQKFYQRLFKSRSSIIRFVDFRRQLTIQEEKFITDKLEELKENVKEMRENGKVPDYQKVFVVKS